MELTMLNIDTKTVDGVLTITLEGKLNNLTSKDFAQRVESELEDVRGVVIDMAKLEYISSAGLRVVLGIQQHLEEVGGESVCVRNANEAVIDTLGMTGLRSVITVE